MIKTRQRQTCSSKGRKTYWELERERDKAKLKLDKTRVDRPSVEFSFDHRSCIWAAHRVTWNGIFTYPFLLTACVFWLRLCVKESVEFMVSMGCSQYEAACGAINWIFSLIIVYCKYIRNSKEQVSLSLYINLRTTAARVQSQTIIKCTGKLYFSAAKWQTQPNRNFHLNIHSIVSQRLDFWQTSVCGCEKSGK